MVNIKMKNIFRKTYGTGALDDPRTLEEKERDFRVEEIMAMGQVEWREKKEEEWRKFPIFDQAQSGSCVAQSLAKVLGIENWLEEGKFVHKSARDIYTRRKNAPEEGMWFQNAFEIGYKHGATIEQLMPSQKMNEVQMNISSDRKTIDEQIALVGKGGNYFWIPLNIDRIASIIEPHGKGVVIGARFTMNEWNRPVPVILGTEMPLHHAVVAHTATLYKGKKALVVDESWGSLSTTFNGRRIITEDWFTTPGRITAALHYLPLKNTWRDTQEVCPRPKYQWNKEMLFGQRNLDIEALQKALMFEELFPQLQITTGFYGNVTARAVRDFNIKYNIIPTTDIEIQGRRVGLSTRTRLNELFT